MKRRMRCSFCHRMPWRSQPRAVVRCQTCKLAYEKEHAKTKDRSAEKKRWYEEHKELTIARSRAFKKKNLARVQKQEKARHRKYRLRLKAAADVVDSYACCGSPHTEERRLAIIRRILPASTHEIREAWSCIWGLPFDDKSPGARRLYRDLQKLGAISNGGTYYLTEKRAA